MRELLGFFRISYVVIMVFVLNSNYIFYAFLYVYLRIRKNENIVFPTLRTSPNSMRDTGSS